MHILVCNLLLLSLTVFAEFLFFRREWFDLVFFSLFVSFKHGTTLSLLFESSLTAAHTIECLQKNNRALRENKKHYGTLANHITRLFPDESFLITCDNLIRDRMHISVPVNFCSFSA